MTWSYSFLLSLQNNLKKNTSNFNSRLTILIDLRFTWFVALFFIFFLPSLSRLLDLLQTPWLLAKALHKSTGRFWREISQEKYSKEKTLALLSDTGVINIQSTPASISSSCLFLVPLHLSNTLTPHAYHCTSNTFSLKKRKKEKKSKHSIKSEELKSSNSREVFSVYAA